MEIEIPAHITRINFGAKVGDGMTVDPNSIKAYQLVDNMFLELDIPDLLGTANILYITDSSRMVLFGMLQLGSRYVTFGRTEAEVAQIDLKITYELVPIEPEPETFVMNAASNTLERPLML